MSIGLTKRQSECLAIIQLSLNENGIAPSLDEIASRMGLSSRSQARTLLARLEERGAIRRVPGRARAIEILSPDSITLNPEIARLVRSYAEQEGIKTETAVNELLRGCLGAAA